MTIITISMISNEDYDDNIIVAIDDYDHDDYYLSDDVSILSVNNSDSSNSRDLIHRFDQLGVPHHLVPVS